MQRRRHPGRARGSCARRSRCSRPRPTSRWVGRTRPGQAALGGEPGAGHDGAAPWVARRPIRSVPPRTRLSTCRSARPSALDRLVQWVRDEGRSAVLLTGRVGTGKTLALHVLAERCRRRKGEEVGAQLEPRGRAEPAQGPSRPPPDVSPRKCRVRGGAEGDRPCIQPPSPRASTGQEDARPPRCRRPGCPRRRRGPSGPWGRRSRA